MTTVIMVARKEASGLAHLEDFLLALHNEGIIDAHLGFKGIGSERPSSTSVGHGSGSGYDFAAGISN